VPLLGHLKKNLERLVTAGQEGLPSQSHLKKSIQNNLSLQNVLFVLFVQIVCFVCMSWIQNSMQPLKAKLAFASGMFIKFIVAHQ